MTRLGDCSVEKSSYNSSKIFSDFLGYFENITFQKNVLWQHFGKIWATFLPTSGHTARIPGRKRIWVAELFQSGDAWTAREVNILNIIYNAIEF